MRDLHSPIAQATAKHQARLKERGDVPVGKDSVIANSHKPNSTNHHSSRGGNKGSVNALGAPPASVSPEAMSPVGEHKADEDTFKSKGFDDMELPKDLSDLKISYAIAIYPYLAEQDDEFNVNV